MKYVYYNGNFYDSEQPIVNIRNRSFHYGDGFFETIRVINGNIFGFDNHFNRMVESFKAFRITPPAYFSKDKLLKKQVNQLSMYKSLNCNLFIQGSLFAQENNLDDAFIQNYNNTIIEATSSNIFIVSNGVLYTPSLSEGCLAGTMRMNIINIALEKGIKVYECTLNPQYILAADEIFLTNAIQGVRWVSSYRSKRYFNSTTKEIVGYLNDFVNRSMNGENAPTLEA